MIEIDERRCWNNSSQVLLIGPGATGKSTLGANLAPLISYRLVDLDEEFGRRNGKIDSFIADKGYERYKTLNSALAAEITSTRDKMVLVTSSGFLTPDNPPTVLEFNMALLAASYSVCLLPSRNLERSASIIVNRQLQRPFARGRVREDEVIRCRFPIYMALGDLVVFSEASSAATARALADRLPLIESGGR